MTKAYVLMTALPPTVGHKNLINWAACMADEVVVIVCTQPHEPYATERYLSLVDAFYDNNRVRISKLHKELPQDPATDGFWPMWDNLLKGFDFKPGYYVVSSEPYGATLAARLDGVFMPYDPARELYYTKATNIREHMVNYFADILPEFQHNLRSTITVFGAESTGKTTLSRELSYTVNGHWLFEWARPYLELTKAPIDVDSMTAIWKGQAATQMHAQYMYNKPFVIQDTDLYSTIGYWEQPHWAERLGPVPADLVFDASTLKSDLYVITKSNIPFEADPLRYGGDHRESSDEYWIALAEKYDLPYVVLDSVTLTDRLSWASKYANEVAAEKAASIFYDRGGF